MDTVLFFCNCLHYRLLIIFSPLLSSFIRYRLCCKSLTKQYHVHLCWHHLLCHAACYNCGTFVMNSLFFLFIFFVIINESLSFVIGNFHYY